MYKFPICNTIIFSNFSSQEQLLKWLEINKIDMEVYSRCPVLIVTDENLTLSHATQMSEFLIEDRVKDEWLIIKREEGVRALDVIVYYSIVSSYWKCFRQ